MRPSCSCERAPKLPSQQTLDLTADRKKKKQQSENCSRGKQKVNSKAIQRVNDRVGRDDHEAIRAAQGQQDSFDCSAETICLVCLLGEGQSITRIFPSMEINYSLSSQPCILEWASSWRRGFYPLGRRAVLGGCAVMCWDHWGLLPALGLLWGDAGHVI